jgi:hypothetical protein
MIGKCQNCGTETIRYGGPSMMEAACEKCGSFIFSVLHFGYPAWKPGHWIVLNVKTNEILSHDPCDDLKGAKE